MCKARSSLLRKELALVRWLRIKCPRCSSRNTVKIVYNDVSPALKKSAEMGLVRLSEVKESWVTPDRFCNDCANEWRRAWRTVMPTPI